MTTLDSSSPQLVDQRLYAAIRRTDLCIADWTGWPPNVFFEIGVRLAVNEIDPIFIVCNERPPGWNDKKSRWPAKDDPGGGDLVDFFKPVTFDFSNTVALRARMEELGRSLKISNDRPESGNGRKKEAFRRADAKLSPGRTYQVVVESIDRRNEPGGIPVFDLLLMEADILAGPSVSEEGGVPVLYSDVLAQQVRRMATEYLITLWHSEDGRYKLTQRINDSSRPLDEAWLHHLHRLRLLGEQLRDRFRNVARSEFQRERAEISAAMTEIEQFLERNRE